ncbi:MAG: alkaline phosphatase family protein [Pseudonocardiaceae bacterium]
MMVGTLSTVPIPAENGRLRTWTEQVARNDGFDSRGEVRAGGHPSSVVPRHVGERSPIQHVIYVVKENRTYDQVFGSLGKGDGDPALNLFGPESAPNARALERGYVTLDNFYADAEVSAQGWNWTVAANSNPYSEQVWAGNYSGRGAPYPTESGDPAIAPNRDPAQAYIWDRLAASKISFRNYGFYVTTQPDGTSQATDPVLDARTDHSFRGFDLSCPDSPNSVTPRSASCGVPRFTEWRKEFDGYVTGDNLPTVELLRLPNDHNAGTKRGAPTPRAYVADNDWALGQVVDVVPHSKYWASTAIFITEDDAQNGPDHVDAHRTVAEVISPYRRLRHPDARRLRHPARPQPLHRDEADPGLPRGQPGQRPVLGPVAAPGPDQGRPDRHAAVQPGHLGQRAGHRHPHARSPAHRVPRPVGRPGETGH